MDELFEPPINKKEFSNFSKKEKLQTNLSIPLAEKMRPSTLEEIVGQDHLLGKGKVLRNEIENDNCSSLLLWGPPGTGKTTIARIIADNTNSIFLELSAVLHGIKELRTALSEAKKLKKIGNRCILFIDEIHRFNKVQQDALLPSVENGTIVLIGATTENPSFEIITPLLSRSQVFILKQLKEQDIVDVLKRALLEPTRGFGQWKFKVDSKFLKNISNFSNGDARASLNILELVCKFALYEMNPKRDKELVMELTLSHISEAIQKKTLFYDKSGDEHYNLISAFHKTLRSSDPDAALYWLGRMIEAGEDPLYILRRLVRFASEDIGIADPNALHVVISAQKAYEFIGLPEGKLAIAQATIYLAQAPKSDSVYRAYLDVENAIEEHSLLPVPLHLRNAPTEFLKEVGFGEGYQHAHASSSSFVEMEGLPDEINFLRFYYPSNRGFEEEVRKKMDKKKNIFKSSQKKDLENNLKVSEFDHRSSDPAMPRKKRKKL